MGNPVAKCMSIYLHSRVSFWIGRLCRSFAKSHSFFYCNRSVRLPKTHGICCLSKGGNICSVFVDLSICSGSFRITVIPPFKEISRFRNGNNCGSVRAIWHKLSGLSLYAPAYTGLVLQLATYIFYF